MLLFSVHCFLKYTTAQLRSQGNANFILLLGIVEISRLVDRPANFAAEITNWKINENRISGIKNCGTTCRVLLELWHVILKIITLQVNVCLIKRSSRELQPRNFPVHHASSAVDVLCNVLAVECWWAWEYCVLHTAEYGGLSSSTIMRFGLQLKTEKKFKFAVLPWNRNKMIEVLAVY